MTEQRRCKILATVGPATAEPDKIEQLIEAGVNGFRFNFSHGGIEDFRPLITKIREISRERGEAVACLADLQGPKLRIGVNLSSELSVEPGQEVAVYPAGEAEEPDFNPAIPISCSSLLTDLKPGENIYINDGQIQLQIKGETPVALLTVVKRGGIVAPKKGVNLPDSELSFPALTEKDKADLEGIIKADFDFIALSFVRRPEDLKPVREAIEAIEKPIDLIAKIETRLALENLPEIIGEVEGVMVARGDLGVEIGHRRVPYYQKEIIRQANSRGKIVITATQMLESMIKNSSPTRAETSDVANAVLDGSDVVMLSGETAVGDYPVETVETMNEIINSTESDFKQQLRELSADLEQPGREVAVSMVNAAARSAWEIAARAVVIPTFSGSTARLLSNTYTPCPLIALCASPTARQKSALYRNVYPWPLEVIDSTDRLVEEVKRVVKKLKIAREGEKIVLLAGLPLAKPGITNMIYVIEI